MLLENDIIIAGPGGNYTAFIAGDKNNLDYVEIDNTLREKDKRIEQVCFFRKDRNLWQADMTGGEFCGAAAMSFAYIVSKLEKTNTPKFQFSGYNDIISAKVEGNKSHSLIFTVEKENLVTEISKGISLVSLPGIYHFVTSENFEPDDILEKLKNLLNNCNIYNPPAAGLIQVQEIIDGMEINPYVWVPIAKSFINETACISGSIAAGIINFLKNGVKNLNVKQPCRSICKITFDDNLSEGKVDVFVELTIDVVENNYKEKMDNYG